MPASLDALAEPPSPAPASPDAALGALPDIPAPPALDPPPWLAFGAASVLLAPEPAASGAAPPLGPTAKTCLLLCVWDDVCPHPCASTHATNPSRHPRDIEPSVLPIERRPKPAMPAEWSLGGEARTVQQRS
ncbi:MAG: hypothetical protein ACHQ53_00310 [Polyangiales bacterium]